jgi:hypothetical protein
MNFAKGDRVQRKSEDARTGTVLKVEAAHMRQLVKVKWDDGRKESCADNRLTLAPKDPAQ